MIKLNQKPCRVLFVFCLNRRDVFFRGTVRCLCREHDGSTVRIVCADVSAFMSTRALKSHPDISLCLFEHVPDMQRRVGIR